MASKRGMVEGDRGADGVSPGSKLLAGAVVGSHKGPCVSGGSIGETRPL